MYSIQGGFHHGNVEHMVLGSANVVPANTVSSSNAAPMTNTLQSVNVNTASNSVPNAAPVLLPTQTPQAQSQMYVEKAQVPVFLPQFEHMGMELRSVLNSMDDRIKKLEAKMK